MYKEKTLSRSSKDAQWPSSKGKLSPPLAMGRSEEYEEEAILIQRAKGGDQDASEQLYAGNLGAVHSYIKWSLMKWPLTGSGDREELAQDLTSETLMRSLKALPGYKLQDCLFKTWLCGIARHVLQEAERQRRKQYVSSSLEVIPDYQDAWVDEDENTEEEFLQYERNIALWRLVDRLETSEQKIIYMHIVQDIAYKEIAKKMNSTEGAIKMRFNRAMKKLERFSKETEFG